MMKKVLTSTILRMNHQGLVHKLLNCLTKVHHVAFIKICKTTQNLKNHRRRVRGGNA